MVNRVTARGAPQGTPPVDPGVGSAGLTPQMSIVNPDRTPTVFFFRWLLNVRGGNQTPWTQDIDAAGNALDNLGALSLSGPITFPDGTVQTTAFNAGAAGIVSSVFGRSGAVTAHAGDYTVGQITGAAASAITISAGAGLAGGGDLTANRAFGLIPATASAIGGVKIGSGITVAADGTISAAGGANLLQSIFIYGATGDGVTDDSHAFVAAIAAGGARLPAGFTYLVNQSLAVPSGVSFIGGGPTAIVKRGAALASGHALFDINGSNVLLSNFTIDGGVTVSVGVNFSTLAGAASPYDPMQDVLSLNSSVWIHGNFNNGQLSHIVFDSLTIQHTGGYAIVLDARNGDICNVQILNPTLINNRPHLFGTTAGDLSYGSWTGGIHWQGNCDSGHPFAVKGLVVNGGTFRRNTGNCIWGHSYAFNFLHQNIRVSSNYFEDSGLDCILIAAASTAVVTGNTGRRVGYIASDDTSATTPKYLGGHYACFIDTSGCASGDYTGNSAVSVYGGFMDLDGFSCGTASGNTMRVPVSGDAEYSEDQIASWMSPNPCYGLQTGNNYFLAGGTNVTVIGNTFLNMAYGAIRLFAARGCHVAGNNINHPANAQIPPILIGNMAPASTPGTTYYSQNNSIAENNIQWSPTTTQAAIQEQENWGAGALPWTGQANWIASNRLFGTNVFEFSRAPSSASTTATRIPSEASGLSAGASVTIRRERISGADAVSMYAADGSLQWRFTDHAGLQFPDGTVQPTAATGGGGSQTPWKQNIDAAGFTLSNVPTVSGNGNITVAAGGAGALNLQTNAKTRLTADSAGHVTINAPDNASARALTVNANVLITSGAGASGGLVDVFSGGDSGWLTGTWAQRIQNNINASGQNGLIVANRWAASTSKALSVGSVSGVLGGSVYVPFFEIDGLGHVSIAGPSDAGAALTFSGTAQTVQGTGGLNIGAGAGVLNLKTNGKSRFTIDSAGNAGVAVRDDGAAAMIYFGSMGSASQVFQDGNSNMQMVGQVGIVLGGNGKQRLTIDSAGHCTINAADDTASALHVSAPADVFSGGDSGWLTGTWAQRIQNNINASGQNGLIVANRWAASTSKALSVGSVSGVLGGSVYVPFFEIDGIGNAVFIPRANACVGIGTTAPAALLDVAGAARVEGNAEVDGSLGLNLYNNGSNWIYRASAAGIVMTNSGLWFAPAGTAGATAPVTQMMSWSSPYVTICNKPFAAGVAGATGDPNIETPLGGSTVIYFAQTGANQLYARTLVGGVWRTLLLGTPA